MSSGPEKNQGQDQSDGPEPVRTLHAVVSGRVQAVGFRLFVLRAGRRLGLNGEVRNLPDGRVEVLAAGSRDALEDLLAELERGPRLGRVDQVSCNWDLPLRPMPDFKIGY